MKRARRGSTLVELCLVIAISAIVFAMIASFAVLIQYRAIAAEEDNDAVREISSIRTAIFEWLKDHDSPDATISVNGGEKLTGSLTLEEVKLDEEGWFKSPTYYEKVKQIDSVVFVHDVMGKISRLGGGYIDRDLLKVRITYRTSKGGGNTINLLFTTYASIIGS